MCNNSTSAGTSLEGTPMFAHVTLHRRLLPGDWRCESHLQSPGSKGPLVAGWGNGFLRTITFLIIHRFLSLKILFWIYLLFKKHFMQYITIWQIVLDLVKGTWQDVGPCCEQTHAAFEVELTLDHGQGVYSGWWNVDGNSQLRLCHTCIIDVMAFVKLIVFNYTRDSQCRH